MSQSTTESIRFDTPAGPPLEAAFDAGRLTSDGGLPWLAEADRALGLCEALAAGVPEWRRGPVRHDLATLVRQRVFQIACGYEDQDDADTLRADPLLKLVCGRRPESGADLASQPTLARLENAVDRRGCYRPAGADPARLGRDRRPGPRRPGRDRLPRRLRPAHVPPAADLRWRHRPAHHRRAPPGQRSRRPGRGGRARAAGRGRAGALAGGADRAAGRQRLRRAGGLRLLRGRAGLAYTIGLVPDPRLEGAAAPLLAAAQAESARQGGAKVRLAGEAAYRAASWPRERRAVYKAEALERGPNTRFVVTTRGDPPLALYDWYVDRGEPELWVKDFKRACFADRLSCHRFWANQFRLLLHAAAYRPLDTLRRWLGRLGLPRLQLDTLRLRLLKVGGRVRELLPRIRLHLASSHPGEPLWHHLAAHRLTPGE
jgi:hypothetical protein